MAKLSTKLHHEHRSMEAFLHSFNRMCEKWRTICVNRRTDRRESWFSGRWGAAKRSFREILCSSCGQNERGKYFDAAWGFSLQTPPHELQILRNFRILMATKKVEGERICMAIENGIENMRFLICFVIGKAEIAIYDHRKILCNPFVSIFSLKLLSNSAFGSLKVTDKILNWHFNIQNSFLYKALTEDFSSDKNILT